MTLRRILQNRIEHGQNPGSDRRRNTGPRSDHLHEFRTESGATFGATRERRIRKFFSCLTCVAGPGALGAGGRWFESNYPDQDLKGFTTTSREPFFIGEQTLSCL